MIRINLLENSKGKNKRAGGSAAAMPTMEMGDLGSPKLKLLVVLLVAGLLNFGYWYRLDRQTKSIASQMRAAEQKNRELSDVKARFLERQKQADNYKRRVDVIDSLRAGQAGPVNLLAMLGQTVNGTEAVWLNKMDDTGSEREPGRHGPEHGRGGQPNRKPAEDGLLQDRRDQGNLPGRRDQGHAGIPVHADLREGKVVRGGPMSTNFNELSGIKQWGAVIAGGALITVALYFTVFKSQNDKNAVAQHAVDIKVRENNELESYRPKLKDMELQLANLKQQLEIERRIVPDEKQVDSFIETMDSEARRPAWKCAAMRPSR